MASYYNIGNQVKDSDCHKIVATAATESSAEALVKVLNRYFDSENYTRNQAVEMMHKNTSGALTSIADFIEKHEYDLEEAVEYLRELADEMSAQALVVSLRDELKFDKPI